MSSSGEMPQVVKTGPLQGARGRRSTTPPTAENPGQSPARLDPADLSEGRFRDLVESVDAIVWEADAATLRLTFVSRGVERILGFSPEQWLQTPNFWANHLHHEDREQGLSCEQQVLRNSFPLTVEYRMQGADGLFRWFRDSMHLAKGTDGARQLLRGIMVDITKNKEAERALRESEQRYKEFAAHAQEGVWALEFDPPVPLGLPEEEILERLLRNAHFVECNLALARSLGFAAPEEVVGKSPREAIPFLASDRERMESFRSAIRGRFQPRTIEFRGLDRASNAKWLMRTEVPIVEDGRLKRIWGVTRDLSDLRQAEEALQTSESRYRSLFEHNVAATVLSTLDGRLVQCNEAAAQILGYPSSQALLGVSMKNIHWNPDERAGLISRLQAEKALVGVEQKARRKDGQPIWLIVNVNLITDPGTGEGFVQGTLVDITERKRAEEKLAEYEKAVEGSQDMIAVVDREYRYLVANRAFLKQRNLQPGEVLGRRIGEVLGQEAFAVVKSKLDECFQGKVVQFAKKQRFPGVGERELLANYFPIEEAGGIKRVVCVLRDVTERKRAEEALRESEERLRSLSNAALEGIMVHDRGLILDANPAFAQLFGYARPEELVGRNGLEIMIALESRARIQEGSHKQNRGLVELTCIRKDGTRFLAETDSRSARYFGRDVSIVSCRDVTERKRAQEELQRSLDQLRALTARLQRVREEESKRLAREIHDQVGQALTALRFDVTSLLGELPGGAQPWSTKAASLVKLVEETIDTVRQISSQLRPSMLDHLGLAATVEWVVEDFGTRTGIKHDLNLPAEDIVTDPERATAIYRILQELLTNVARHARATEVFVQLQRTNRDLILLVRDNGKGMPAEKLSAKESLGILGMHERALAFGGELVFSSAPGEGTSVKVRIPEGPAA